MVKKEIIKLFLYIFVTFSVLIGYHECSRLWISGIYTYGVFFAEFPFVLVILILLYFPKIKNLWVKFLIPCIPVLILYICFDVFFVFLCRIPRVSDLRNIWMVFDFSPFLGLLSVVMLSLIPGAILVLFFFAYKSYEGNRKKFWKTLTIRCIIFSFLVGLLFSELGSKIQELTYSHSIASKPRSIRFNGRLAYFIFQKNLERKHFQKLKKFKKHNSKLPDKIYPGKITDRKNVHIIVLESFMDPRLIKGLKFSHSPIAKELTPFLSKGKFSLVQSPSYGGGTPQAEFEILTGVKSLQKLGSVEFNVMMGNRINAFVAKLKENGYRSIATITPLPEYYNSALAYRSIGFDSIIFLEDVKPSIKKNGDWHIFDGDVFDYNLKMLEKELKSKQPLCNYVLGMYAHYPFRRNKRLRPDVIKVNVDNGKLESMVNQFYYRTKALGKFIRDLLRLDPDSIILVISDHLPPGILHIKGISYPYERESNISLYLKNSGFVDISNAKYFEIPHFIWNDLSGNKKRYHLSEQELNTLYYCTLSDSLAKP